MRVLLVEDDPNLQTVTARLIRVLVPTAEVTIASTADEAIRAIIAVDPECVLSDYDLGDGSKGSEVLAWITKHRSSLVARFVFVSGNAEVEALHSRTLMKPYSRSGLRAALMPRD